jgi:hypothetical protein
MDQGTRVEDGPEEEADMTEDQYQLALPPDLAVEVERVAGELRISQDEATRAVMAAGLDAIAAKGTGGSRARKVGLYVGFDIFASGAVLCVEAER